MDKEMEGTKVFYDLESSSNLTITDHAGHLKTLAQAGVAFSRMATAISAITETIRPAIQEASKSYGQLEMTELKSHFDSLNSLDEVKGEKRNGAMSRQQAFGGLFKK